MNNKKRLLIIGLDAADSLLIRQWADAGIMTTFAKLFSSSLWGDSHNPSGMVAGTVWPTFYTGILPGRTGRFRGTSQFLAGTYEQAPIDFSNHRFPEFWSALGRQGVDSLVIDAPYSFLSSAENVEQVVDWCSHSAWHDGVTISRPDDLADKLRNRYGRDPVGACDFVTLESVEQFRGFTEGLIQRIETKTQMTLDAFHERKSSLLMNVFSECHCAGHQLWHLHDPGHPDHDPVMAESLGYDPIEKVYAAMDAAVGRLIAAVQSEADVLVFCSHGIGPAYTGTHLLDEILLRLEERPSPRRRQALAQVMVAAWTRLPQAVRTLFTPLRKKLWPKLKSNLVQPGKERRKFFEVIVNDASGGVRLNVKGREPEGLVDPGVEYDELCAMLERELLAVVNPSSGRPLVARVLRSRDIYPGEEVDQLPDLMVLWERSSGPISEAQSGRIGLISRKFEFRNHRTGDHTENDGLFFFAGAGTNGGQLDNVSVADFASTISGLYGCELPGTDGSPIESLVLTGPARVVGTG